MQDGAEKQKAQLNQQMQEQLQQMDKTETEASDRLQKLYTEIEKAKTANPDAVPALQQQLDSQWNIINLNAQKRLLLEKQTTDAIQKVDDDEAKRKRAEAHDKLMGDDQVAVDNAKNPAEKFSADRKLIDDKFKYELEQAAGNKEKIKQLTEQHERDITQLTKQHAQERKDFELQMAQQVSDTAFSLIKNSIKNQSDAKIKGLEADKASELSNKNLTANQRKAIEAYDSSDFSIAA